MDPEIKRAGFAELPAETAYRLWQLRTAVFVVEQGCAYQELDGRDLESTTRHFWTDDSGGAATAYLRLLAEPLGVARIGRVCVARSARAGGLGRLLMHAAHYEVGRRDVVVDAQSHLAHWYAEMGYRLDGPGFVEDGIPHVPMRRKVLR